MVRAEAQAMMRSPRVSTVLFLGLLGLVACGDDTDDGAGSGGGSGSTATASNGSSSSSSSGSSLSSSSGGGVGGEGDGGTGGEGGTPVEPSIAWSACSLYVDDPNGIQAECATVDVPLRWAEPDGPTLGVFVQRLAGTASEPRKQLWLLEGGPGGSGADFDAWMEEMREIDPTVDLYAVDHRGVGRSARLGCPDQEDEASDWGLSVSPDEAAACHEVLADTWGADLAEFTSTAAARDLGRLIELAEQPGQDVFVYGVSYGTYWAHRYLQIHPEQATAVILDSIAPSTETFVAYDSDFDAVGQDLMDLCAGDAVCAGKLGPDPWAALEELHAALDDGHCRALTDRWGLDAEASRVVLATLLMSPLTRTYIPALVYRHARCKDEDVAAIDRLLTVLFAERPATYYDTLASDALFYNVAYSELWPEAAQHPTIAEIAEMAAGLHVSTGLTTRMVEGQSAWPTYADDAFVGGWATTSMPLLMMNGDLDPQTPIWVGDDAAEHFTGPGQSFLTVPRAAHCVIAQTPAAEGERSCGMKLLLDFLGDPLLAPDTSCYAEIPEETFTGDPAWNEYLLGTRDLWENGPQLAAAAPASPPNERLLREVRRRIARVTRAR
jgi:pimeloyl-ACP methyl ester carboxylesterase